MFAFSGLLNSFLVTNLTGSRNNALTAHAHIGLLSSQLMAILNTFSFLIEQNWIVWVKRRI